MARFLGALVLCLAVAVFAVQNDLSVHLIYLGMTAPAVHLAFLILAALVLGAAVTVLLGGLQVLRLRRRIALLERELSAARLGSLALATAGGPAGGAAESAPPADGERLDQTPPREADKGDPAPPPPPPEVR